MTRFAKAAVFSGLVLVTGLAVLTAGGQTRRRGGSIKKAVAEPSAGASATSGPQQTPTPAKRNERPQNGSTEPNEGKTVQAKTAKAGTAYKYEFSQPEFNVGFIRIEHNDSGEGTISFRKKGSDELISDPIQVSPAALARINEALAELNYLESEESYQYEKDFSHLGNIKFSLRQNGRSREVTYNWTENKGAKALMTEYRRIGNQFIWIFDITLSRDNQPLDAPRLFDSLDSMIRRNEISDPHQLEPFLKELANDERIPLIARNHSDRLVKQFEKERQKKSK